MGRRIEIRPRWSKIVPSTAEYEMWVVDEDGTEENLCYFDLIHDAVRGVFLFYVGQGMNSEEAGQHSDRAYHQLVEEHNKRPFTRPRVEAPRFA